MKNFDKFKNAYFYNYKLTTVPTQRLLLFLQIHQVGFVYILAHQRNSTIFYRLINFRFFIFFHKSHLKVTSPSTRIKQCFFQWELFSISQLEDFDMHLRKLFKQEVIDTVIRYERLRREIYRELFRRQLDDDSSSIIV